MTTNAVFAHTKALIQVKKGLYPRFPYFRTPLKSWHTYQKDSFSCEYFNVAAAKHIIKIVLLLASNILLDIDVTSLINTIKQEIIIRLKKLVSKNRFVKRLALSQVMPEDLNNATKQNKKTQKNKKRLKSKFLITSYQILTKIKIASMISNKRNLKLLLSRKNK